MNESNSESPRSQPSSPLIGEEQGRRNQFWSRFFSRQAQFVLDISVLCIAFVIAYLLRFEFQLDTSQLQRLLAQLPLVVLIQIGALVLAGVYSFIWRYVGLAEMASFVRAALWSGLILLVGRLALPSSLQIWRVPLSIILMSTFFGFAGVVTIRVLRRILFERFEQKRRPVEPYKRKRILDGRCWQSRCSGSPRDSRPGRYGCVDQGFPSTMIHASRGLSSKARRSLGRRTISPKYADPRTSTTSSSRLPRSPERATKIRGDL